MKSTSSTVNGHNRSRKLPDFLVIGAQRSGTSWLNKNLGFHPEIWLTPIKELHFFDRERITPAWKRHRYFRHMRRRLLRLVRQLVYLDNRLFADLAWDAHYFLRKRTNDWYIKLFRPRPDQVAGETTPAYATLSPEKIREIWEINPELKLIYLMRDPIERSWSGATKDLAKRKKRMLSEVPDEEIYAKLDFSGVMIRSNHWQVLETWQSVFPADQFLIAFFEDVVEKPKELLLRIYTFLGVTPADKYVSPTAGEKINPAGKYKAPIPERFQVYLAKQQIGQLRELSKRFGGPASKWMERAEKVLADHAGLGNAG